MSEVQDAFRRSMRQVASSVCVIAAGGAAGRVGITATSVCSVSMVPPLVLACINAGSLSHDELVGSGWFSVNVLAGAQQDVADVFAGRSAQRGEQRFHLPGVAWREGPHGVPMLEQAVATLACRIVQRVPAGTHSILIGEVAEARTAEGVRPLLYLEGQYHALPRAAAGRPACTA